jgi:hypothetical protein
MNDNQQLWIVCKELKEPEQVDFSNALKLESYKNEAKFYSDVANKLSVRVPKFYLYHEGQLWIEDLAKTFSIENGK